MIAAIPGRLARRLHELLLLPQRRSRTGGWPPEPAGGDALQAQLAAARPDLERLLGDCILPFWRQRAVDRAWGGYHLHHDRHGRDLGPAPKHVIAQTRTTWFFARVYASPWGEPGDAAAARHGFEFLRDRMWDARDGGFCWQVEADGRPRSPHKHALAQGYAIFALARCARSFDDGEARDLAARTFELFDAAAHDGRHGGYREMLRRDWSDPGGLTGYWAADPALKLLDTHLHLLEAFAALHEVHPHPRLAARIRELTGIVATADCARPQGVTRFRADWTPLGKRRVEYGFDMKRIWLTEAAARTAGVDTAPLASLHRGLFDRAVRCAWDLRDGGLFNAGRPGRRAHELVKTWWTQAEALVASLWMWRETGEERYARVFLGTLAWIVGHQADWTHGEWHERVDHRGRPGGRKAWDWKGPYHGTRAVLECLRLLAG